MPHSIEQLVIAGWTGRNLEAVDRHVQELAALGVAPPRCTPIFYRVSASLLTEAQHIQVIGRDSTGEVEFVILRDEGKLLVGLGSDHTDRKFEAVGVTLSKQMCPKPIATDLWEFADVAPHWYELILRSFAVVDGVRTPYQEGSVSAMRRPEDLLARYTEETGNQFSDGWAMFCGTFAVTGGIRWADEFIIELEDPVLKRTIKHSYTIEALPIEG